MEFAGQMDVPLPLDEAFAKLSDLRFLTPCIPGAEETVEVEETRAACRLKPGFAFVRGTLDLTIERTDMDPEKSVSFHMHSKGVGSTSEVESQLTFEEMDGQTKVQWKAEVNELGGLLKAVPKGLIRGAAQKVIADVWERVTAKMENH